MKIAATLSILTASLATASTAFYKNCEKDDTGAIFTKDFAAIKPGINCAEIDTTCLGAIIAAAKVAGTSGKDALHGVGVLKAYCDGGVSDPKRTFASPGRISDATWKAYLEVGTEPNASARQAAFKAVFGDHPRNCEAFTKLKDVIHDDMWPALTEHCALYNPNIFNGVTHDDIVGKLDKVPKEVWESISAHSSAALAGIMEKDSSTPPKNGLLDAKLADGKLLLEHVRVLSQLDASVIEKIKDGAQVLKMLSPFSNLNPITLDAIQRSVWEHIGSVGKSAYVKTASLEPSFLNSVVPYSASSVSVEFRTGFRMALPGIDPTVLKGLSGDSITTLDGIIILQPEIFPFLDPAAIVASSITVKDNLRTALTNTSKSPIDYPAFYLKMCGAVDNAAALNALVAPSTGSATLLQISLECFNEFKAPLKGVNLSDFVDISGTTKKLKEGDTGFPSGFKAKDFNEKVFASLDAALNPVSANDELKYLCSLAKATWFDASKQKLKNFTSLTIHADCLNEVKPAVIANFEKTDTIMSKVFAGKLKPEDVTADELKKQTDASFHPFNGITEEVLKNLDKSVWNDYFTAEHAKNDKGIPYDALALGLTDQSFVKVFAPAVPKLPQEMLIKLKKNEIEVIRTHLTKEQWSQVKATEAKDVTLAGLSELKEAIEDKDDKYKDIQTVICGKYATLQDVVAVTDPFKDIKMAENKNCFMSLTRPLNGAPATAFVDTDKTPLEFKATKLFTEDDFKTNRKLFLSLGSELTKKDDAVLFLCSLADKSWLIDGKKAYDDAIVSKECFEKMQGTVSNDPSSDYSVDFLQKNKGNLKSLDEAKLIAALGKPENALFCSEVASLKDFPDGAQPTLDKDCFGKIPVATRIAGMKITELDEHIMKLLTEEDVHDSDKELWAEVDEAKLKQLAPLDPKVDDRKNDKYKNHVCSKITDEKFIDAFSAEKQKMVHNVCEELTGVKSNASFLKASIFLTIVFAFLTSLI